MGKEKDWRNFLSPQRCVLGTDFLSLLCIYNGTLPVSSTLGGQVRAPRPAPFRMQMSTTLRAREHARGETEVSGSVVDKET